MLHTCVERFDVMGVRGNILGWDVEVNKALMKSFFWENVTSDVSCDVGRGFGY
jgi:hypothetical protein